MDDIVGIQPSVHYINIITPIFKCIKNGDKQLKVKNNKNYNIGDTLIIDEFNPTSGRHSGNWTAKEITSVESKGNLIVLEIKDIIA